MSTECHWKVRLASQRSKRLYLDWERLLRRLETNRTLFEVVPSGDVSHVGCFPRKGGGAVKPQESAVFIPNWRDRRAYPGSTTWREVSTTVADQGEGSGGARPSLILDQTEARRAKKIFFINHPPYLRVWMTASPPPPPHPTLSKGCTT